MSTSGSSKRTRHGPLQATWQVRDHDVGPHAAHEGERFVAICGFAHDDHGIGAAARR
jgi:hypothetical protein